MGCAAPITQHTRASWPVGLPSRGPRDATIGGYRSAAEQRWACRAGRPSSRRGIPASALTVVAASTGVVYGGSLTCTGSSRR